MKVLFVCSGNLCRSPLAGALLLQRLTPAERALVAVSSAGTLGLEGRPADPGAIRAAADAGIDLSYHRSRALDPGEVAEADLVLVMEERHARRVLEKCPGHPGVRLLGSYLAGADRGGESPEIDDPLGEGPAAFRHCMSVMERAIDGLLRQWREVRPGGEAPPGAEAGEQRYFREVESRVIEARGGAPGLSSLEFHIVDGWWRTGAPLWLVLEAIGEAVLAWPPGEAPRRFLRRVEPEVARRMEEVSPPERGRPGGADDGASASRAIEEALRRAAARSAGVHPEIHRAASALLLELGDTTDQRERAGILARGRGRLCEAARRSLPLGGFEGIRTAETERLRSLTARLSPRARRGALARLIEERLLEWFDLPSLPSKEPGED